jgi:hypothetical protein
MYTDKCCHLNKGARTKWNLTATNRPQNTYYGCHSRFMSSKGAWGSIHQFCHFSELYNTWGDLSLFCLDSMRSSVSAKSSQLCRDKVSLSDRPWMSSYIMQCVSWLWTVLWPSSDYFPGELKWRRARYSILQVRSARNSNTAWWFRTNC